MSIHSADLLTHMRRLRWTAFGLVAAAFILSFFHRIAPAAIAGELQQAFQTSGTTLGVLAATYFYVYTVMQIPTGVLVDTLGPRRIVTLGGIIAGIGSVMFGLADTLTTAIIGRTLVGLGVSVTFISLLKINSAWFKEREFATLVGLTMLMGNIGAVFSAAPLAWVVTVTSWRNVFVAVGIFSLILAVLTWFLVRDNPGEAGLPSMREMEGKDAHLPHQGHWVDGLLLVMRNPLSWPGFWTLLGIGGTFLSFAGLWAVPYLTQVHGMTRTVATYHTSLMLIAFAVGSLLVGTLSDRLGHRRPLLIGLGSAYFLLWLVLLAGTWSPLPLSITFVVFAVMGLCATAFTLCWSCAKEVNPPALSGMATSLVNTGAFLGAAIYQPLVGWVLDRGWRSDAGYIASSPRIYTPEDFQLGIAVMVAFALLGLIGAWLVKETYCRNINVAHN